MMMENKRVIYTAVIFVLLGALFVTGLVWTVTQAVRESDYEKSIATVTALEKENLDGEDVIVKVLVSYEYGDDRYEDAVYIGDLNRCKVGQVMQVWYLPSGDKGFVYSKASDLGFALILLGASAVWLVLTAFGVCWLKRTGFYDRRQKAS